MHKYVPIYSKIWSDQKFQKLPSALAKLIFIYLISGEDVTLTGIFDFELDVCKARLGEPTGFAAAFKAVVDSKLIQYDEKEGLVWVVNRFKYIVNNRNPNILRGVIDELARTEHPFKDAFVKRYDLASSTSRTHLEDTREGLKKKGYDPERIDSLLAKIGVL